MFGTESRERFARYQTSYVCVISSRSQLNFLHVQPSRLIDTASPIDTATMGLRQVIAKWPPGVFYSLGTPFRDILLLAVRSDLAKGGHLYTLISE